MREKSRRNFVSREEIPQGRMGKEVGMVGKEAEEVNSDQIKSLINMVKMLEFALLSQDRD